MLTPRTRGLFNSTEMDDHQYHFHISAIHNEGNKVARNIPCLGQGYRKKIRYLRFQIKLCRITHPPRSPGSRTLLEICKPHFLQISGRIFYIWLYFIYLTGRMGNRIPLVTFAVGNCECSGRLCNMRFRREFLTM